MTFAEKVRFVRGKLQLSQIDLAKILEVTNVTVNRWEVQGMKPSFLAEQRFNAFCTEKKITFEDGENV